MTKSVLITGASTGIGKAAALLFMKKGWNVAATMRSPEKEKDWTGGEHVAAIRLDVNDIDSIREGIGETIRRFGAIDVIVNNAGYGLVGPFEASSREQVERQFATNVFGLMNVTREILPHFRERRGGAIVNVASAGGRITFPLYSVYNATKWAVEGFSESLQFELRPCGIRVRIVEPGPIKTGFYDRSRDLIQKPGLTAYDSFVSRAMPAMQRAGETGASPESVAKVIWKAATDRSWRLRYAANAAAISLRRLLPDRAFNALIRKVLVG